MSTLLLDLTVNGLIMGVFYALMAVGLALIFGILKVVNFAHGESRTASRNRSPSAASRACSS